MKKTTHLPKCCSSKFVEYVGRALVVVSLVVFTLGHEIEAKSSHQFWTENSGQEFAVERKNTKIKLLQ